MENVVNGGAYSPEREIRGWGYVLAVDPGEVHVGVAEFSKGRCAWTREFGPEQFYEFLEKVCALGSVRASGVVVVEEFRLYPGKAAAQSWSQLKTVEVIGTIRYITGYYGVTMVEQGAHIKKVARARMGAQGVVNLAVEQRLGRHCADAVEHGWFYINHGGSVKGDENTRS